MTQLVAGIGLGLFAIVMAWVGLQNSRHSKTMAGFLLGSRKIGAWMSAFAYGTSYFSAVVFVGYAGKLGWEIGLGSVLIGLGNAVLGCFLAWKVLANPTRRMTHRLNARTMPELFEMRFVSRNMKIVAAAVIFVFLVPYAASVYKGLGYMFSALFPGVSDIFWGLDANVICMFFVAFLTAFYLMLGGYKATVVTDFIQGIIMIGGVLALAFAIVNTVQVGGLAEGFRKLSQWPDTNGQLTSLFGGDKFGFLMTNILLTSFGTWAMPQMVSKFYAIRDEQSVRRGTLVSTGFALIIGGGAYFVGLFGRFFITANEAGAPGLAAGYDGVVPEMLMKALGNGLLGNILLSVVLLLLLSASMSTLSSLVLTSSSALSVDLVSVVHPKIKPQSQMLLTRILCVVFVALSFLFATVNFAFIVSIMSYSWGVISGCFMGPFVWGIYSRKITRAGAWAGFIGGFSTVAVMALVFTLTNPAVSESFGKAFEAASANSPLFGVCAMAVSVVVVPIVSQLTKPLDPAHVKKVFGDA